MRDASQLPPTTSDFFNFQLLGDSDWLVVITKALPQIHVLARVFPGASNVKNNRVRREPVFESVSSGVSLAARSPGTCRKTSISAICLHFARGNGLLSR